MMGKTRTFLLHNHLTLVLRVAFVLFLLTYFVYHLIQGERGILSWIRLNQTIQERETTLADLKKTQENLARRVGLLHPQNLDKDMLEERVRTVLNFAEKEEMVLQEEKGPECG